MGKGIKVKTSKQDEGKHPANSPKQNKGHLQNDSISVEFLAQRHGPLIFLHFKTSQTQHHALARMEAFYESESGAKTYISLQDPKTKLLCRNYQAFNMPILAIQEWLTAMQISENASNTTTQGDDHPCGHPGWWRPFTNSQESLLLDHLWSLGLLKTPKGHAALAYLISVTDKSAIRHELLHALFYLHSGYREKVQDVWEDLSSKCRLTVSKDLLMRDYGGQVWVDEFQAYVSENAGEFGRKLRGECEDAGMKFREAQVQAWKDLDLNGSQFT